MAEDLGTHKGVARGCKEGEEALLQLDDVSIPFGRVIARGT